MFVFVFVIVCFGCVVVCACGRVFDCDCVRARVRFGQCVLRL